MQAIVCSGLRSLRSVLAVVATVLGLLTSLQLVTARAMHDTTLPIVGEVAWQPEVGKQLHSQAAFVGSPSVLKVNQSSARHSQHSPKASDAAELWLASHDRFFDIPTGTAFIYASNDLIDWEPVANITPMYWAQLFQHHGKVYIIGTYGDMSGRGDIMLSMCLSAPCNGTTWSKPVAIFTEPQGGKYHCAPTPVVVSNNTLYRAFDAKLPTKDGSTMTVLMLEADVTPGTACASNLTDPACWSKSDPLYFNGSWVDMPPSDSKQWWEEAGAIVNDNGDVSVMVRLDYPLESCTTLENCNRAALLDYDTQHHQLKFRSIVDFPSSCNKFAVRFSSDGFYYTLTNPVVHAPVKLFGTHSCGQRNTVVLARSRDLVSWQSCDVVLEDDTGLALNDSLRYTGLQYIDFRIDGPDLIAAVRAGYRGSVSYHNANRLLIVRISDFAKRCS